MARRTFNRALQALPLTQHNRVWPSYIKFVRTYNLPETAVRVYRRYLKVRGKGRLSVLSDSLGLIGASLCGFEACSRKFRRVY